MYGIEIDMVVMDSKKALELYEKVFDAECVEATDLERGLNEAVFMIYDTRFHILDENPEYELEAPKEGEGKPIWFNITVPDVKETYDKALENGFKEIQPITEMKEMGVSNAACEDPFGYVWIIHQVHREVSFEKRTEIMEEKLKDEE